MIISKQCIYFIPALSLRLYNSQNSPIMYLTRNITVNTIRVVAENVP